MNKWPSKTLLASGLGTEALAVCRLQKIESVLLCLLPHMPLPVVRLTKQCHAHLQQRRLRLRHEWQAAQPVCVYVWVCVCQCLWVSSLQMSRTKQQATFSQSSLTPWPGCQNAFVSLWTKSNKTKQPRVLATAVFPFSSGPDIIRKNIWNKEDFGKSGQGQISSFLAPLVFSYSSLNQRTLLSPPTNYLIRKEGV